MDYLTTSTDKTLARRIKRVTMSHNTKASKDIFQNGQYVGEYHMKSKFFLSQTVKGRSVYNTVEELIVIIQGYYRVSTYKLVMTEKHFNSNLKNTFDGLTYRVFRNVEASPPTARVEEIWADLHSRQREHDTSDDTDSSVTDSESNSGDDKTELSCSDSEIDNTEATSMQAELSDDSVCELDGFSSLFNEDEGTDLVEDDASDSGDDQESSGDESNSGDNNIELRLSDSESADDNTEPAETEPVVSDDSVCKLLDGFSSLFGEREESDLSEDDEFDSDNDQESSEDESNNEDNNIELGLSDSESADDNTEPAATEPVMSDDSVCKLLDGFSSLFGERGESDLSEDDEFDSDNDQESSEDESNNEDNNIELGLSDSESVDDDTEPTATEPELPDDSVCEYLDGFFSLFYEHGESDLGVDDEFCYQHADDERKSVDNEDADAVINYDQLQSCLDEDSLCLLDGVSTLFEDHRESESDFPDDEERIVSMLGESKPEDKQEPTVQSTPEAGHWDMAIKSLKIAAGVAGVGLALYAAYKYFR